MVEITRLSTSKRREEIRRIIEEVSLWNVNKSQLALKFGVSDTQIDNDIKKIIKTIPTSKLKEPVFEFFHAYKKNIKEMRKLLIEGNTREKILAAHEIANQEEKFTKMLENYNLKPKVAEKVEHEFNINDLIERARESKKCLQKDMRKLRKKSKKA